MMSQIFSFGSKLFEEVKPLFSEMANLRDMMDEEETREGMIKLIRKKDELEEKIYDMLIKNGAKHEELENEEHEHTIAFDLELFFNEYDNSIDLTTDGPLDPKAVERNWRRIKDIVENANGKKKAIKYVKKLEENLSLDPEEIGKIFDKWQSILRHAAENGNFFYLYITES